jgi:CRP-like cAMP-binding protein
VLVNFGECLPVIDKGARSFRDPMTIEDDIAFLKRVPTFAQLGFSALQIVAIGSETKQLADGDVLFRAGETADAGYVIQEGALKLTRRDPKQSDSGVTLGPGVLVGELALLTETIRPATATAAGPTIVIRVSRSLFRKVLEGFPEAARITRDRLTERANQAAEELSTIRGTLDPRKRR